MIPFAFAYIVPNTLDEAAKAYSECVSRGQKPVYYAGGTEIITMGRVKSLHFDAVIDLKHIQDMYALNDEKDRFVIGAGQTLNDIIYWNRYPLLAKCSQRVADHTSQCKITLGGNIAGTVIYHETSLAFLLADATAVLFGPEGKREATLSSLFTPKLTLEPGEFIVQFFMDKRYGNLDYIHVKQVESEKIGYPIFTLAAVKKDKKVSAAVSGLYAHPVWADYTKKDRELPKEKLADKLKRQQGEDVISDVMSSGEYRLYRLNQALDDMMDKLGGWS